MSAAGFRKQLAVIGVAAGLPFPIHPHMLRHACGFALAHGRHDTRAIQEWLGHRNIQHTTRYTELTTHRFKDFWQREDQASLSKPIWRRPPGSVAGGGGRLGLVRPQRRTRALLDYRSGSRMKPSPTRGRRAVLYLGTARSGHARAQAPRTALYTSLSNCPNSCSTSASANGRIWVRITPATRRVGSIQK